MLFANSTGGDRRKLLLLLQAMDTAGKGRIVRHVMGGVDPQGISYFGFKAPTKAELRHDFLWRIRKQLPAVGMIGVFDRSHYEDVLIARVHELAPAAPWFVVPADRKWYARLAVQHLLIDALKGMVLAWPPASFDIEDEKLRLATT